MADKKAKVNISFADHFGVSKTALKKYGAFNISLVSDVPLFIDPFLLFNSKKPEYQALHDEIIDYLIFLRKKTESNNGRLTPGLINALYKFPEVKQNWFGYTVLGNSGRGLGPKFADSLNTSFSKVLSNFGDEQITAGIHLEKILLVHPGVGKDAISDFTTNLIKRFLLQYTQEFATKNIDASKLKVFKVPKAEFNYTTETWASVEYTLPAFQDDFLLLTPIDILTKNDVWINRPDLYDEFERIPVAVPNDQLRAQINNYFSKVLNETRKKDAKGKFVREEPTKIEKAVAALQTIREFPVLIDYYIKNKEDNGQIASSLSLERAEDAERYYVEKLTEVVSELLSKGFYEQKHDTYEESLSRLRFFKDCIENNDIYKHLYKDDGTPRNEEDVHRLFYLVWYGSPSSVDREVANGRGAVDYSISVGAKDKTLVEFKLASSTQLKKNIENQLEIYKKANRTDKAIWGIVYFTLAQRQRAERVLKELGMEGAENVVLIDARKDNKQSASKANGH